MLLCHQGTSLLHSFQLETALGIGNWFSPDYFQGLQPG
jgi:hypothetical protein